VTTFPASFWAMLTTLLGFLSLVFVEAEPLKQLGLGGTVGTLVAFLSAYLFFPIFLRFSWAKEREDQKESWSPLPLPVWIGLPVAVILLGGSVYYGHQQYNRINTDPSLLTYFKPNSAIYQGIAHVDRLGGSNPLNFVISSQKPGKLTNGESYQAMRNLQNDLESHPAVGSVLSLAALMEETQTNWMARLLPWGSVLNVLSKDQYGKVARGFISDDFNRGLFVIRIKETAGVRDRRQVIRDLKTKPAKHGLKLEIVGGTYYLQSELSKKVESSMKSGVTSLFVMFFAIIFLVSFSPLSTLFASVSIAALVAAMVGVIGYLKVPFDIISSPAINICLGIAVDGMIHLIMDVKRHSGGRFNWLTQRAWQIALRRQAGPTFVSAMAVACGFSVFALSEFPPSQRFGLEIVFGSVVAMLLTLLVLPQIGVLMARRHQPNPYKLMAMPELEPVQSSKELEAPIAEVIELKKK
jgi:predicted RND superfamily exporter protein